MSDRCHLLLFGIALLQLPLMAQRMEPPVPADPLEFVTSGAQPSQDITQRGEIVNLLMNAHRNSNVRAQPYDLKTTFTVSGSSASVGTWQEEDISPGAGRYRWTAQGPNYSVINLHRDGILYSNQPVDSLPLRLVQVREAIFYTMPNLGPQVSIRTAKGNLNGTDVVCAVTRFAAGQVETGPRGWDESEYCVNAAAGTLVTYSPVPGLYVQYDYSKALRFHGKLIPNKFTITQAGQVVIEAITESVTDPANDPAMFQSAGLNQIGVGPIMSWAWRLTATRQLPAAGQTPNTQFVILHGMRLANGHITDVELLASSDPSLNADAAAAASAWQGGMAGQANEPGVTPQSREALITIRYRPRSR